MSNYIYVITCNCYLLINFIIRCLKQLFDYLFSFCNLFTEKGKNKIGFYACTPQKKVLVLYVIPIPQRGASYFLISSQIFLVASISNPYSMSTSKFSYVCSNTVLDVETPCRLMYTVHVNVMLLVLLYLLFEYCGHFLDTSRTLAEGSLINFFDYFVLFNQHS